jgi:endonuclease/exonuclease/phosphatase family metal-dependent hydrolase
MSWATQSNQVLGTEADFVEACQKEYKKGGLTCIDNAIKNIGKLEQLDLIGLQEVNSEIEERIMKMQPRLTKFKRGKIDVETSSILWNPDIFGKLIADEMISLVSNDDRPCLILVFQKEEQVFIIINLHAPGPFNEKRDTVIKTLKKHINKNPIIKNHFFDANAKIIILGDFNDNKTSITKNKPLVVSKSVKLTHIKTKDQAQKTLKSCCWHKPGHKYKYFSDTGDYILVNKNITQKSLKIPEIFRKAGRTNRLFADHMPVLSVLDV